jgi:competence protein ComGC
MSRTKGGFVMKKKGITLMELMVVALISSIIGTSVVFVISNSNNVLSDGVAEAFRNSNTQRIMDLISIDVKQGARLSSDDSKILIVMDASDNNLFEWASNDGIITRYDDMGSARTREIKIFSTANRVIRPNITFTTSITGQFYNVKVDAYMKELTSSLESIKITKLSNIFYCRLDPLL